MLVLPFLEVASMNKLLEVKMDLDHLEIILIYSVISRPGHYQEKDCSMENHKSVTKELIQQ